ncbi:MAG: hypothetical protein R6U21_02720 [Thermoplasmatota archaeon]
MWIVIVASGSMILGLGSSWAGLSLGLWALLVSALVGIFIVLDIVFLINPNLGMVSSDEFGRPTEMKVPEYRDGKRIYEFTFPNQAKGGLFSKIYLQVDDTFLIRIRNQMFSADELWSDQSESESSSKENDDTEN